MGGGKSKLTQVILSGPAPMQYDAVNAQLDAQIARMQTAGLTPRSSESFMSGSTVPTEILSVAGAEASGVELAEGHQQTGCFVRVLSRRPRAVLAAIYALVGLTIGLLVGIGELQITVDQDAFINRNDIDYRRAQLVKDLKYSSFGHRAQHYVRRLQEDGPDEPQHERTLSSVVAGSCTNRPWDYEQAAVTMVYTPARRGAENVLEPTLLQQIQLFERRVASWLHEHGLCDVRPSVVHGGCECAALDSALGYLFPAVVDDAGLNRSLVFGGVGADSDEQESAGLRCGSTLSRSDVEGVVGWLRERNQTGFFGRARGDDALGLTPASPTRARYLKTVLWLEPKRWKQYVGSGEALGLTDLIEEAHTGTDGLASRVRIHSDVADTFWTLPSRKLEMWLVRDLSLLAVATVLILAYMVFYFRNIAFALAAVMQIVISLPIMFFVVDTVLRQRPVSALACTSLWVVIGVSADNVFVVRETWRASSLLRVNGELAPRERRLRWTLAQSARPLIVADSTTAFSLLLSCFSPIDGVFQFGLCGGILILTNFALVLCYMPALLAIEEDRALACAPCRRCCSASATSETDYLKKLHVIHAVLFKWRRVVLLLFVALVGASAFPAARLLQSQGDGGTFDVFPGLSVPDDAVFLDQPMFDYASPVMSASTFLDLEDAPATSNASSPSAGNASSPSAGNASAPSAGGDPLQPLAGPATTSPVRPPDYFYTLLVNGTTPIPTMGDDEVWPTSVWLLIAVLVFDGLFLLLHARLIWIGRHVGLLRCMGARQRSRRQARQICSLCVALLALAFLAGAVWVMVLANDDASVIAANYGCNVGTNLQNSLGTILIAHGVVLGALAVVNFSDRLLLWYHGYLRRQQRARCYRFVRAGALMVLSAGCLAGGLLLLLYSALRTPNDDDDDNRSEGHTDWQIPPWQGGGLALLLIIVWSSVLMLGAASCFLNWPIWHFHPPYDQSHQVGRGLLSCGVMVHLLGWTLFVVCGYYPNSASSTSLGLVLVLCLLLTAAAHLALVYIIGRQTTLFFGFLAPTELSSRKPLASMSLHALLATAWLIFALAANAANLDKTTSPAALFLALVLLFDAAGLSLMGHVLRTRRAIGIFRPLDPELPPPPSPAARQSESTTRCSGVGGAATAGGSSNRSQPLTAPRPPKLTTKSMVVFLLATHLAAAATVAGCCTFILSGSKSLTKNVYGARGVELGAGVLLLAHLPWLLLCLVVFSCGEPLFVVRPPPMRRTASAWRRRRPLLCTLLLTSFCATFGALLLAYNIRAAADTSSAVAETVQEEAKDCVDEPDMRSFALSIILAFDAVVMILSSWIIACGFTEFGLSRADHSSGTRLIYAATALIGASVFFAHVACMPELHEPLGRSHAISLLWTVILSTHAVLITARTLHGTVSVVGAALATLATLLLILAACLPNYYHSSGEDGSIECLGAFCLSIWMATLPLLDAWYFAPQVESPMRTFAERRVAWKRRVCAVLLSGIGAGAALLYERAWLPPQHTSSAVGLQLAGSLLLVHALPLSSLCDVWYTARPFAGYEPADAPTNATTRKHGARVMLLLALLCVAGGAGSLSAGMHASSDAMEGVADVAGSDGTDSTGSLNEPPLELAEPCYLVWGLGDDVHVDVNPLAAMASGLVPSSRLYWEAKGVSLAADLLPGFDPTREDAQRDLAAMCDRLVAPSSPMHSSEKSGASPWDAAHFACTMAEMRLRMQTLAAEQGTPVNFPIHGARNFTEELEALLWAAPSWHLQRTVGFLDQSREQADNRPDGPFGAARYTDHIAYLLVRMHSKYKVSNGELIGKPNVMRHYMQEWKSWFEALPERTQSQSGILSKGFVSCASWQLYPTLTAFLDGILRSLVFTPLFCVCAVFLIVRDVAVCYAAFVTVASMLVVAMGTLNILGLQLGPIESLAVAVIIGVSIDYLIHLAFAYKHSLMLDRYCKSRAAMLARFGSISSAALTTLASVMPLLASNIGPLRHFGTIFTIVTVIAYVFTLGFFNALMMLAGPLNTRPELHADSSEGAPSRATTSAAAQDDVAVQQAQLRRAKEIELAESTSLHV